MAGFERVDMARWRSYRRPSRRTLMLRAPRKGTIIIAVTIYLFGLFTALGWIAVPKDYGVTALAIAGALLILGSLMRDL
ncbi:MAG: hypothetical protein N2508_16090 [Anaerolineae bacterium]|nr:hypothetical protein [Anaerolineae bacterium]